MKKKILLLLSSICIICCCIGCMEILGAGAKTTIRNLAYDVRKSANHMIYIKENNKYEPYFVLTKDYYGKTLLMRYYLMDEPRNFNIYEGNGACNAYYPDTLMDKFLSEDFYNILSPKMRELILDMDIDITTRESVDAGPVLETEKLRRKIFLLSTYEINSPRSSLEAHEGMRLKYYLDFDYPEDKMAYTKNGEAHSYWLRTAHTWDDYTVTSVSYDQGIVYFTPVDAEFYVRPIFCIEGNTPVFKKDIGDKKLGKVYVIE